MDTQHLQASRLRHFLRSAITCLGAVTLLGFATGCHYVEYDECPESCWALFGVTISTPDNTWEEGQYLVTVTADGVVTQFDFDYDRHLYQFIMSNEGPVQLYQTNSTHCIFEGGTVGTCAYALHVEVAHAPSSVGIRIEREGQLLGTQLYLPEYDPPYTFDECSERCGLEERWMLP